MVITTEFSTKSDSGCIKPVLRRPKSLCLSASSTSEQRDQKDNETQLPESDPHSPLFTWNAMVLGSLDAVLSDPMVPSNLQGSAVSSIQWELRQFDLHVWLWSHIHQVEFQSPSMKLIADFLL